MNETLLVGKPNLGKRDRFNRFIDSIYETGWLTNGGPLVQRLEKTLADYLEVKHCILVCNATIGLQVAARALDLSGEVIVPAFTFIATPHSVEWIGLKPVFCDVEPTTHLLNPNLVESLITPRTTAILGVHTWGQACHPELLQKIADRHGLQLYFDAAHAFGCRHNGTHIGNFGRCEVFSFHATKFFNTFEGGAITTNDDALAAKLRAMINFGIASDAAIPYPGTNAKMSEAHAAMGLACFARLDEITVANNRNLSGYREGLANLPGIRVLEWSPKDQLNDQYVVVEIDPAQAGIDRESLLGHLAENGITGRPYFTPACPDAAIYREAKSGKNPVARRLAAQTLTLPTGPQMGETGVQRVCDAIRNFL